MIGDRRVGALVRSAPPDHPPAIARREVTFSTFVKGGRQKCPLVSQRMEGIVGGMRARHVVRSFRWGMCDVSCVLGVFQWCQCVRACVLRGEEGTRVTADGFELVGERSNLLF